MATMRTALGLVLLATPVLLQAQTPTDRPALDFSGLIFGNFQVRTDSQAKFQQGGKPATRFDLGRVYLNFRMPAGERGSIRVTTDLFQNTAPGTYYAGWAVRLKYAYFQYDATRNLFGVKDMGALARIGMVHNVVVDHIDSFWPRWFGQNAVETHGFFASADVGAASLVTLPGRKGEVYATVMNGSNYTSAETDRFKDFAGRFSFTPFGNDSGFFRTLAISPWFSKGWKGSNFRIPTPAQVGPVSEGIQKDRGGVFVGVRDRRVTGGAEISQIMEEFEFGANTVAAPRFLVPLNSTLISGFAIVRPVEWFDSKKRSRFALIGRYDQFDLDRGNDQENTFTILGALWDLNARTSLALDYQELSTGTPASAIPTKTFFLHWVTNF
jgi:hypothetical protein